MHILDALKKPIQAMAKMVRGFTNRGAREPGLNELMPLLASDAPKVRDDALIQIIGQLECREDPIGELDDAQLALLLDRALSARSRESLRVLLGLDVDSRVITLMTLDQVLEHDPARWGPEAIRRHASLENSQTRKRVLEQLDSISVADVMRVWPREHWAELWEASGDWTVKAELLCRMMEERWIPEISSALLGMRGTATSIIDLWKYAFEGLSYGSVAAITLAVLERWASDHYQGEGLAIELWMLYVHHAVKNHDTEGIRKSLAFLPSDALGTIVDTRLDSPDLAPVLTNFVSEQVFRKRRLEVELAEKEEELKTERERGREDVARTIGEFSLLDNVAVASALIARRELRPEHLLAVIDELVYVFESIGITPTDSIGAAIGSSRRHYTYVGNGASATVETPAWVYANPNTSGPHEGDGLIVKRGLARLS